MYQNVEKELAELNADIDQVRVLFEQFFMGIEKLPPQRLRDDIARRIRRSDIHKVNNTELKFRFRTISQRFVSLNAYWDRMFRMIEDGTFRRDRHRSPMAGHPVLQRRMKRSLGEAAEDRRKARPGREPAAPETPPAEESRPKPAARQPGGPPPLPPAAATAARATGGAAPNGAANGDRNMRGLYREYVKARKETGESLNGLTFDGFKRSVGRSREAHITQLGCSDLQFKVKTRGGRATLVAVPVHDGAQKS